MTIPRDWSGSSGTLFQGSLATFDPAARYTDAQAFTHQFPNGQDFSNNALETTATGKLLSHALVARVQGDMQLPDFTYAASAVIVATGKVTLGRVTRQTSGSLPIGAATPRLVIVSLGGPIKCTGGTVQAALIAPNHTLEWSGSELDVEGSVCVKQLPSPNTGGSIRYDIRFDPTVPANLQESYLPVLGPSEGGFTVL